MASNRKSKADLELELDEAQRRVYELEAALAKASSAPLTGTGTCAVDLTTCRQVVAGTPNPIFTIDNHNRIAGWNEACRSLFGFQAEETIGREHAFLWAGDTSLDRVEQLLEEARDGRVLPSEELNFHRAGGGRVHTLSRIYRVGPSDLAPLVVFANTDITDIYQAEEELRQTGQDLSRRVAERTAELTEANEKLVREIAQRKWIEEELRGKNYAVESSLTGIAFIDLNGRISYTNAAARHILGYEEARELLGRSAKDLWADAAEAEAVMTGLITEGSWVGPTEMGRRDGQPKAIHLTANTINDDTDRPTYWMASIVDLEPLRAIGLEHEHKSKGLALINRWAIDLLGPVGGGLDLAMEAGLADLSRFCRADRAYIFTVDSDGRFLTKRHEWSAPGMGSGQDQLQRVPLDKDRWSMDRLMRLEKVMIDRLDDLPPEAVSEKPFFEQRNVKSLVNVPIGRRGRLKGLIGLDTIRSYRAWSSLDVELLTLGAEIVGRVLPTPD